MIQNIIRHMHILHCNMKIKMISNKTKKLFGVAENFNTKQIKLFLRWSIGGPA